MLRTYIDQTVENVDLSSSFKKEYIYSTLQDYLTFNSNP